MLDYGLQVYGKHHKLSTESLVDLPVNARVAMRLQQDLGKDELMMESVKQRIREHSRLQELPCDAEEDVVWDVIDGFRSAIVTCRG